MSTAKETSVPPLLFTAFVFSALGFLVFGSASFAQSAHKRIKSSPTQKVEFLGWKSAERPLTDLNKNAFALQTSVAKSNHDAAELLISIRASTTFLRDRWTHSLEHPPVPKSYVESLQLDADTLGGLTGRRLSDQNTNAILRDVADDLEIKVAHCKASLKGWASVISVNINTLKQGNPIAGLEVWYVPKGWADVPERWMRCPKLSSPATAGQLPPGKYMVRVAGAPAVPVTVGGSGKDEQSIDLLVP